MFQFNKEFYSKDEYVIINNAVYTKDMKTLMAVDRNLSGSYTMPIEVEFIFPFAFLDCHLITEIICSQNLKCICMGAFSYCINLEKISIPQNVIYLGCRAFKNCKSLKKIVIPNNVPEIFPFTFDGCNPELCVTVKKEIKQSKYSFYGCNNVVFL